MRAECVTPEYVDHHCKVLRDFSSQLALLWESRNRMKEPREVLLRFLVAWLGFHILGEDHAMAKQIGAIRAGTSPAAAYERLRENPDQDHSMRALIDALQGLSHTLWLQNQELAEANARLEERVAERTRELAESNATLRDAFRNMENLAHADELLGVANRRQFDRRLDLEWRRAYRAKAPLSLLMIDVDHFKRFNDFYGHPAGDNCLRTIARAISCCKRATDLVARYGGEELAMLLPDTPLAGAESLGCAARAAVEDAAIEHAASPVTNRVTVSVGVASAIPGDLRGSANLIAAADRALYAAKTGGRNRVARAREG